MVLLYFNSIKVRLKRAAAIAAGGSLLFQFHKGTIKTDDKFQNQSYNAISIP